MIVNMLKNWSYKYSSHFKNIYIYSSHDSNIKYVSSPIKSIGFEPIHYAINLNDFHPLYIVFRNFDFMYLSIYY